MRRLPLVLLATFIPVVIASGLQPLDRSDWMLENVLVFLLVPLLALTARRFPFSNTSYLCLFVFLCIHELGGHYSYSNVPYYKWFGIEDEGRNHFDRFVHLLYGLLVAYPMREIFLRIADVRGFWGYFLPLDLVMSTSMLYELIEWAAAEVFGGELGQAFLGSQGDPWDAHKDMALASLGALLTMSLAACIHVRSQRDFSQEFLDSLKVKH